jgi:sortase A
MTDDDKKHKDQFDAALPLPVNGGHKNKQDEPDRPKEHNPAADLIRKKVEQAYANEPNLKTESQDIKRSDDHKLTKHQEFIVELTSSGKPLHEIQMAWHEYYAALPDAEKHEVWQEFYKTHAEASHYHAALGHNHDKKEEQVLVPSRLTKPAAAGVRSVQNIRGSLKSSGLKEETRRAPHSPLKSLVFGLGIGCIVLVIFLFSFFNERFIAPFIQPSRNASGTPIISTTKQISESPEIIIPKINVEIPVVYDVNTINEAVVEKALEGGVVHYADTAMPGQNGNLVIVGHSSNNIFNPGKYKFAFVLLSRLEKGDTFYLDKDGQRYTYEIYKKTVVKPTDVSVLGPADKSATATLITCDPPGTSTNRLVVVGEQIDPSPAHNKAGNTTKLATETALLPGNSPTLWSRFIHWLWD